MFPFNSETKKMTVAVETEHEKTVRIYTKGATENILDDCVLYLDKKDFIDLSNISMKDKLKSTVLKEMA